MPRQEYTDCMVPHISGTGKTKEQRLMSFCIGAKLCSKKARTKEEARQICSQPKPAKETKAKRGKRNKELNCEQEIEQLVPCIVDHIDMEQVSNINSIGVAIANAMLECKCG